MAGLSMDQAVVMLSGRLEERESTHRACGGWKEGCVRGARYQYGEPVSKFT